MEALILSCGTGGGHNAAGYAVKEELERRGHNVKMLFIATDYTCIPFTEETECDTYVIPSDKLTREFVKRGVPKERLLPLGIPVRREFAQPYDRLEVADRLGLDNKQHYILITGGSIGAGKLVRAVKVLARRYHRDRTVKLIVICGNNRRLYHKLYEQYGERLSNLVIGTPSYGFLLIQYISGDAVLTGTLNAKYFCAEMVDDIVIFCENNIPSCKNIYFPYHIDFFTVSSSEEYNGEY